MTPVLLPDTSLYISWSYYILVMPQVEVPTVVEGHRASMLRAGSQDTALVFLFTSDNSGSPSADTIIGFWQELQRMHPNATIAASSIDAFVEEVIVLAYGVCMQMPPRA